MISNAPILNVEQAHFNMVEQQIRPWDVLDQRVLDALRKVPRDRFVPPALKSQAFTDVMLPIECHQVMMSPVVEGRMLQALAISKGDRVLEIGTGTGFTAACLATLGAAVTSVELFNDLSTRAAENLNNLGIDTVVLETGDASQGWNDHYEYDAIAITGALVSMPEAYKRKLKVGGRLFAIVGQRPVMQAVLWTRVSENNWVEQNLFETDLPYLIHAEPKPAFNF